MVCVSDVFLECKRQRKRANKKDVQGNRYCFNKKKMTAEREAITMASFYIRRGLSIGGGKFQLKMTRVAA